MENSEENMCVDTGAKRGKSYHPPKYKVTNGP